MEKQWSPKPLIEVRFFYLLPNTSQDREVVSHLAHNQENIGANPIPATIYVFRQTKLLCVSKKTLIRLVIKFRQLLINLLYGEVKTMVSLLVCEIRYVSSILTPHTIQIRSLYIFALRYTMHTIEVYRNLTQWESASFTWKRSLVQSQ